MIKTIKRLLAFARPWRGTLALTVSVLIAGSLLNLATPAIVRRITAILGAPAPDAQKTILLLAALLTLAYVVRGFMRFLPRGAMCPR